MKKAIKITSIIAFWVGIWYLAVLFYSLANDMDLSYNPLFPYPHDVILSLFGLLTKGSYYLATITTLLRILFSIIVAVALGTIIAIVCAKFSIIHSFIKPLLSTNITIIFSNSASETNASISNKLSFEISKGSAKSTV